MKKLCFALAFCLLVLASFGQKTEVLLIGTFHFRNPGLDVAKLSSLDIKLPKSQAEIAQVVNLIAKFNPTKFFVEFPYQKQPLLVSLYSCFLQGKPTGNSRRLTRSTIWGLRPERQWGLKALAR